METIIECTDVKRIYSSRTRTGQKRETVALNGLNLQVSKGTVFGLLGPNGAGKTTTIRILSTLLIPNSGKATVAGFDVVKEASEVRKRIGLILGGERGLYGRLTGKENLNYFAAINHMSTSLSRRRVDEVLKMVNLTEASDRPVEQYSRGMRQRLHVARGLLTDPEILFMDEPTIGLDPVGAQELRQMIPNLIGEGKTVLLTTHYMFEADTLCHTVAMINKGKLVALGSPTEIKLRFSKINIVEVIVKDARRSLVEELGKISGIERVDAGADGAFQKVICHCKLGADLQGMISETVGKPSIENIVTRTPTLEEAYLSILK